MAKSKDKQDEPVMNEVERAHMIIDKYIRNENDRAELKKNMTPLFAQFLLRWVTGNDFEMEERVVKIVMDKMQEIYLADNSRLCKSVVDGVMVELKEYLAPWNDRLEGIENALEGVGEWQISVNSLIRRMEGRIEDLKCNDETADQRLSKLERYISWKSWLIRKVVVIIIAVALALILFFQILNNRLEEIKIMLKEHVNTEVTK